MQTCNVERLLLALPKTGDNRWVWADRRAQRGGWTGLTNSPTPSPCQCRVCGSQWWQWWSGFRKSFDWGCAGRESRWTIPGLRTYCKRWEQRLPRSEQELGLRRKLMVGKELKGCAGSMEASQEGWAARVEVCRGIRGKRKMFSYEWVRKTDIKKQIWGKTRQN